MYNKYLKPIYYAVLNKNFYCDSTTSKLNMQYIVYLCITMGAPIGNYGFRYSEHHGPVSTQLYSDMAEIGEYPDYNPPFDGFSDHTLNVIKDVRHIIEAGKKTKYSVKEWLECLCSIIHLKKFVLSSLNTDTEELFDTMKKYQPHLNDDKSNKKAYELVKNL